MDFYINKNSLDDQNQQQVEKFFETNSKITLDDIMNLMWCNYIPKGSNRNKIIEISKEKTFE